MPHKDPVVNAAYHAAYEAKRRGTRSAYMAAWRESHSQERREYFCSRVASGQSRLDSAKNRMLHREQRNAGQRAYTARRRQENSEAFRALCRAATARYRERASDPAITWVDIQSDDCGVCHDPLVPDAVWPDPMPTTIGHEPPLARIADGFTSGVRRPEHWSCNHRKHSRLDAELAQ